MLGSAVVTSCCVQIGYKNQHGVEKEPLSKEKAVSLVQDVFMAAAERDIYTGDGLKIHIITAAGVEERQIPLRRDQAVREHHYCISE